MFKRKTKSRLKRALSGALALTMAASVLAVMPVSADNTSHTYFGDGYEVNYSIKSSWDGNQNIEVALTNVGSEPMLNWALKYNANGEINGLWNGTVYSSDSTKYIVKNAGYNYELLPEQTITFGYTLTGDDLAFPDTIELCSQRTERSNDDYAVTMDVTDDWGTGFNGTITIENMGESALEAWQLSFDTNFVIDDIWNAQIVSSEENYYTVANDVTTTPIGVGESKVFGFRAGKETDTVPEVFSFAMSEMTVNDDFSTIDITDDEEDELLIYAFGKYNPDENVINIEWYTNVQNGSFELMESYNNEDYIKTSVLMNTDSYTYPISQDFDTRYFKVKQTSEDGRTAESVPFVVNRSESGYSVGFLDSDGDGLADIYEEIVGIDINKPDTDEDSLTDYQEVYITGTDPTKYDSVTEGVSDADVDSDNDGLSNADEIELGTDPNKEDSDGDGLKDGEEVGTYGTDPLKVDTDDDGLEDGDEICFESDPLNIDSDGNGISDGDEKRLQTFIHEVENKDCAVTEVRVSMEGTGNIQKTTTVESIMGRDVLCSQAVGLVGEPFEIETDSQFDTATITYVIDKSKLGETEFDKLMFLWYDEENDNFVELDTVLDEENSTASVVTEHFSKYLLVDSEAWFLGWKEVYDKIREALSQHTPGATVLISKCSNVNDINKTSCTERIVENVVNSMSGLDILSFMMYQNSSCIYSDFTSDKNQLEWNPLYYSAATTANYGIGMAAYILDDEAAEYKQRIVFITDSSVTVDSRYLNMAIANNIPIYFICISDFNTSIINSYALLTGGRVFEANTIDEIDEVCNNMDDIFNGKTDTDHDGFSDIEETMGLLVDSSCNPIKTNYLKPDTDDDGLDDNEEVDVELTKIEIQGKQGNPSTFKYYHHMWSDPTKVDTDGDGLLDGKVRKNSDGDIIAPIDPCPKVYTGPIGLWETHISEMVNPETIIPTGLGDYVDFSFDIEDLVRNGEHSDIALALSNFLQFRYDNQGMALHSQTENDIIDMLDQADARTWIYYLFISKLVNASGDFLFGNDGDYSTETWQKATGYNWIYDWVFKKATNENMKYYNIMFSTDEEDYILWIWRGDYLNLGSGAEIGLYTNPHYYDIPGTDVAVEQVEQWDAIDFLIPMKLYLYNKEDGVVDNIFRWEPYEEQWWITGFNPQYEPVVENQIMIGTLDLSFQTDLYERLKLKYSSIDREKNDAYLIFDDDEKLVWIMWYEELSL